MFRSVIPCRAASDFPAGKPSCILRWPEPSQKPRLMTPGIHSKMGWCVRLYWHIGVPQFWWEEGTTYVTKLTWFSVRFKSKNNFLDFRQNPVTIRHYPKNSKNDQKPQNSIFCYFWPWKNQFVDTKSCPNLNTSLQLLHVISSMVTLLVLRQRNLEIWREPAKMIRISYLHVHVCLVWK